MSTIETVDAIENLLPQDDEARRELITALNPNLFQDWQKERRAQAYRQLAPDILAALGEDAGKLLADLFTDPVSHEVGGRDQHSRATADRLATLFAGVYLQHNPTEYAARRLIRRLRWCLDTAGGANESKFDSYLGHPKNRFLLPGPAMCLFVLASHLQMSGVDEFLRDLVAGKFDRRIEAGPNYSGFLYKWFFHDTRPVYDRVLQRCHERGWLTYELFRDSMTKAPIFTLGFVSGRREKSDGADPDYVEVCREFGMRFLTEAVDGMPDTAGLVSCSLSGIPGLHWIDRGLGRMRELGYEAKDLRSRDNAAGPEAIKRLVSNRLAEDETEEQLVEMLKGHDEKTLLLALPHAYLARVAILEALGWDDLIAVQDLICATAGGTAYTESGWPDIPNGMDSTNGVLDRAQSLAVLEAADPKRLDKYLGVIRSWGGMRRTMMLLDALRGHGREKIEKALVKHGQAAIKAYGLLPVDSDDELRERYLRLKTIHKEVARYGSERQVNSRAAVQAAMRNLAQAAGFRDEVRMEWELEADVAESMAALDDWHEIEQWRVRLELDGISPVIRVEKKGKALKSVPPGVRKTDYYKSLRENQEILRAQARRFRRSLEDMMAASEAIDADLLGLMKKHPALRSMLRQLIMIDADGGIGLFDEALDSLTGLDGAELDESLPLRIAHVHDLDAASELPGWQQRIVSRRMVQPFKQAFRELYVRTADEASAGTQSARFAGQAVRSGVAARLLQSRGWRTTGEGTALAYKRSDKHNLTACLLFREYVRFFTEESQLTVAAIEFRRGRDAVPLSEVDPLLFSETMRDADLVASVAAMDEDEAYASGEVITHRWDVLQALLDLIAEGRVTFREPYAHVQGRLASYRIHLASGAIYIDAGDFICILPENTVLEHDLYLPFADTDPKMAEILGKALVLLNDDKIQDEAVVSQIEEAAALAPMH